MFMKIRNDSGPREKAVPPVRSAVTGPTADGKTIGERLEA